MFNLEISQSGSYVSHDLLNWVISKVVWVKLLRKWKLKKITKQTEEFFFHQCCKKIARNTVMASRFWLAASIIWLYESHFSLVYFQQAKIHFSLPISPFWCAICITVADKLIVMVLVLSTWGVESERHWRSSLSVFLFTSDIETESKFSITLWCLFK